MTSTASAVSGSNLVESREAFVEKTSELLSLEHAAEVEETTALLAECTPTELEEAGIAILKVEAADVTTGLYGRTVATFQKHSFQQPPPALPSHRLSSGDIVGLFDSQHPLSSQPALTGVVHRVKSTGISVVFDDDTDCDVQALVPPVHLALWASDVTLRRYRAALNALTSYRDGPASALLDVCFGTTPPRFNKRPSRPSAERQDGPADDDCCDGSISTCDGTPFKVQLNDSQRRAVVHAIRAVDVACIHGPPGTGKTTTMVEVIRQLVVRNRRVLVCAPSNVAVDNLLERCISIGLKLVVRLGHPSRIQATLLPYCLDSLVRASEAAELCSDIRKEMDGHLRQLNRGKAGGREERRRLYGELKELRKELRQRERRAVSEVLGKSQVVFATCTGADDFALRKFATSREDGGPRPFDVVCIDEAAQALEVGCWIPLLLGRKAILAGDHKQLAPTIKSKEAQRSGLDVTLFQRLQRMWGDQVSSLLDVQYRMSHVIMEWSSETFYDGKLKADQSVEHHTIQDLIPHVDEDAVSPMVWIDAGGLPYMREDDHTATSGGRDRSSRSNRGEAEVVMRYATHLVVEQGLDAGKINIITPYNRQVELLRSMAAENESLSGIPIATVDSFQGREEEVVIISLVRSNIHKAVGFLSDHRRLNVAVTRAKRQLVIVGDSATLEGDPILFSLYTFAQNNGLVRYACEFVNEEDIPQQAAAGPSAPPKRAAQTSASQPSRSDRPPEARRRPVPPAQPPAGKAPEKPAAAVGPPEPRDEENGEVNAEEARLRRILEDVKRRKGEYSFPASLSSYQRRLVHELAESLGLRHESKGEGDDRFICVMSRDRPSTPQPSAAPAQPPTEPPAPATDGPPSTASSPAAAEDAADEEVSHIPDVASGGPGPTAGSLSSRRRQQRKNKKKTPADERPTNADNKVSDEALDEMLAASSRQDWICALPSCSQSTKLIGTTCSYCRRRFCISHAIAEAHGCGDEASRQAKQSFRKEQTAESRGGGCVNESFGKNDWRRREAQKSLQAKIADAQARRKAQHKKS